jgi:hypothetical protein
VIPTVIVLGVLLGVIVPRRAALLAVPLIGLGWAVLVSTTNAADFLGGFAYGAANAAVGVLVGISLDGAWAGLRAALDRRR